MGEVAKNFIIQFHELTGDTLKERHRNLFKLLHQHKLLLLENNEELLFISKNLKAKNHLEKIFRIDFLIYFKIFDELYSEFTSGNDIAISKLAKQDWFFQKAFQNLPASEFVNTILPTIGHNVKLKILRKLALEEAKCDEIFDGIKQKYGLFLAVNILPICSVSKIQTVFTQEYVVLTESQLQKIYKKEPTLISLYIEERTKHQGGSLTWINSEPILEFIAQKNPKLFSDLFHKYLFDVRLGHRTSKRLISEQKDDILADRKAWIKILNKSKLVRKLGNQLKDLFFVENEGEYERYWVCLLPHYPKKYRFDIYKTLFNDVHNCKFGENADSIPENVLKLVPNADERQKYGKIIFEKDEEPTYRRYFAPKYLLQEFMEKLPQTTVNERARYVENIAMSCTMDEDFDTLLKLFQLVAARFKNDDTSIRFELYFTLTLGADNKAMLHKLSDQHWQYLMEIMATEDARNEAIWHGRNMRLACAEYLLKNNQPIKEFIYKCNDDFIDDVEYSTYKNNKVIAQVLRTIAENGLSKFSKGDKDEAAKYDCKIATIIKRFNEKNPKHFINILENPRILASVFYILKKESVDLNTNHKPGIGYMLCQKNNSPDFDEMRKLYFSSFNQFGCIRTCFWFLKHDPKTFKEHYDQFLSSHVAAWGINQKKFWGIVKKYTHLGLDEATINFCKLKLQEENYENKSKLVKALAIVSDPDDYIQFITKSYLPTDAIVDLTDEDTKEKYLIQGNLVKYLHFTNAPAAITPLVSQFCKGDYLRHALSPLYSLVYRLPEDEAMKVAQQLFEMKAVSTRKHAINLICIIFDQITVRNYFEKAPIPIFKAALKYFVKNPSETFWNLLEKQILKTENKDLQIFKSAMNVTIPYQYKAKYIETISSVLDMHKNVQITKHLFENVDTNIDLKPEFAYRIIKNYIFKIEEANAFIANLLININDDGKFECMREILTGVKSTQVTVYKKLDGFIKCLSEVYMKSKKVDVEFAQKFSNMFKSIFRPHEAFEEYIIVDLWLLKGETIENSANILLNMNRSLTQRYGTSAGILSALLTRKHILPHLYKNEEEVYRLIHTLLKKIQQEHFDDYVWIIRLLPKSIPELATSFSLLQEIKTVLSGIENETVQLYFNLYLKSETDERETNEDCTWCA